MYTLFIEWPDGEKESYVFMTYEPAAFVYKELKERYGDQISIYIRGGQNT